MTDEDLDRIVANTNAEIARGRPVPIKDARGRPFISEGRIVKLRRCEDKILADVEIAGEVRQIVRII